MRACVVWNLLQCEEIFEAPFIFICIWGEKKINWKLAPLPITVQIKLRERVKLLLLRMCTIDSEGTRSSEMLRKCPSDDLENDREIISHYYICVFPLKIKRDFWVIVLLATNNILIKSWHELRFLEASSAYRYCLNYSVYIFL